MAQIQIAVRNQNGNALTSIGGTVFLAILNQNGRTIAQKAVTLRYADADFPNLTPGNYTALVRHPEVSPSEVTYDVTIQTDKNLLQVQFIFSEPERVFLRVRTLLA